jgi:hypothetical protein
MKTVLLTVKAFLAFILIATSFSSFAQPDYVFKNPVLEAGSDLQPGAVYLFSNVKPGVDARVQVLSFNGGISLDRIDEGWTGFDDAFQPFIYVPPSSTGYVEFEFRFYNAGTSTLMNQNSVPMSPIDVDGVTYGSGVLNETDEIELISGYYNHSTSTSEIIVNQVSGWIRGRNASGWSYPGIDTAAKNVMFTVVNANVSTIRVRIGAANTSTVSEVRYRSVYFKRFSYQNGLLPANIITNFTGLARDKQVFLQFNISEPEKIGEVVLERSASDMKFETVQQLQMEAGVSFYSRNDAQLPGISFYRLKITSISGQVTYSNVLKFNYTAQREQTFKIFPSVVTDHVQVQFYANQKERGNFQLYDYNGRLLFNKNAEVQQGANSFSVDGLSSVAPGNYIAVFKTAAGTVQQKIVKQ